MKRNIITEMAIEINVFLKDRVQDIDPTFSIPGYSVKHGRELANILVKKFQIKLKRK